MLLVTSYQWLDEARKSGESERRRTMLEGILGGVAFAGLFTAWVVVPTYIRKRHERQAKQGDID